MLDRLFEDGQIYVVAKYCLENEVPKDLRIKIIEKFIEKKRIQVLADDLHSLKPCTAMCILSHCIGTEQRKTIPKIVVTRIESPKKRKWKTIK